MKRIAIIAPLLLTLVGCSSSPAPKNAPVTVPTVAEEPSHKEQAQAADSLREQAMAKIAEGKPKEAASLLRQLINMEGGHYQNLNDLSYAYLLAGNWIQAREEAEKAIQQVYEFPAAHYNSGMASLELGELGRAEGRLMTSVRLNPNRYEPHVGLARVYLGQRNDTLADYHIKKARALAPGEPEVAQRTAELAALRQQAPKAPPASCAARLVDGPVTLCLQKAGADLTLYALDATGQVTGSHLAYRGDRLEKAAVPGEKAGYWLRSNGGVIDETDNSLWILREGRPTPVIFAGDRIDGPMVIRAFEAAPVIRGDLIEEVRFYPAGRTEVIYSTWKISADLTEATLVKSEKRTRGK